MLHHSPYKWHRFGSTYLHLTCNQQRPHITQNRDGSSKIPEQEDSTDFWQQRELLAKTLTHPPCPHLVPPAAALCNRATVRGTTAAVTTCIAAESAGNGCAPADKLLRRRKTSSESSAYGKSPMAGTYCCQGGCQLAGSTGPSGRGLAAPPPPVGGDYPDLCAASDIIACVRAGWRPPRRGRAPRRARRVRAWAHANRA